MADPTTILIAYDSSEYARSAIRAAGRLFPGHRAVVVTVWNSVRNASKAARIALPQVVIDEAVDNLDGAARDVAAENASAGATLAREVGLDATSLVLEAEPSVWATIVRHADQPEISAVVLGSRGEGAIKSMLLGSTSTAVVQHCRRPVVVVPSEEDQAG